MKRDLALMRYYYCLGGPSLLIYKICDKMFGTSFSGKKIQKIYKNMPEKDYPSDLQNHYYAITGKRLNLTTPETFNEKIQWMKINDVSEFKTRLTDKYAVRAWIDEMIGNEYLIPLIGCWKTFQDIDFSNLPNQFVLKTNHGCAWNIIVKDKKELNTKKAKRLFDQWISSNFAYSGGLEMQYKNIQPLIIAEQYIDGGSEGLVDYKFHCFCGEPKLIEVIGSRAERTHSGKQAVCTVEWENHPGKSMRTMDQYATLPPKPKNYTKMLEIARKLSAPFSYVRVDLYNVDGKIYFGEMTFTPACGIDPTDEYFTYADLIKIPSN